MPFFFVAFVLLGCDFALVFGISVILVICFVLFSVFFSFLFSFYTFTRTQAEAKKQAHTIGINKKFKVPGENGFPFAPFFDKPKNNSEKQAFVDYFQQIRHESINRLIERCYKSDGTKNKFWFQFGKKRFMNVWNSYVLNILNILSVLSIFPLFILCCYCVCV